MRNGVRNTKFGLHYHHQLMNSISRYSFVLKLDMLFCSYAILYMNWTSRQDQSASIDLESVELTNRYTSCERCKGLHWRAYRQVWPSGRAHRSNKRAWYNCDCWWCYTVENVSWSNYFVIFGHHVIYDLLLLMMMMMVMVMVMMMMMMMMMIMMTMNLSWQIDLRWSVFYVESLKFIVVLVSWSIRWWCSRSKQLVLVKDLCIKVSTNKERLKHFGVDNMKIKQDLVKAYSLDSVVYFTQHQAR